MPSSIANAECDWDAFDSDAYFSKNYEELRDDDRQIVTIIRDFFASADIPAGAHGVDVGAGTNLYPTLALLPFCAQVDLIEYAKPNVHWLRAQLANPGPTWKAFWEILIERPEYARVTDVWTALAQRARVTHGSVFDLPVGRWGAGTMFFVACSFSNQLSEFRRALHSFLRSLCPGAPFAIAFMCHSSGYAVSGRKYPAVSIGTEQVTAALDGFAYAEVVHSIDLGVPLRSGYDGMLVVTGRATGSE